MLMIAHFFKMGTLKGLLFCALIMTGKMMIVEGVVYESADTVLKFSQCLIERLSESPFFTFDDRDNMIEVQDVLTQALSKKEQTLFSSKVRATAFVTSVADIVILDDDAEAKNTYRKGTYSSALDQCSISTIGYTDNEFIDEARKILSSIENNKAQKHHETTASGGLGMPPAGNFGSFSYSQASGVGNPLAVRPSPVQNPPVPQYPYSNDKTVFEQQENPYTPSIASSAQALVNPQYEVQQSSQTNIASSFGTPMQARSENLSPSFDLSIMSQTGGISSSFASSSQYGNFPVGSDTSKMQQFDGSSLGTFSESFPLNYDAGGIAGTHMSAPDVFSHAESLQTGLINNGGSSQIFYESLNIPQTKESSVVVIPPNTNQQFSSYESLPQNPQHRPQEEMYQPSNQENSPKPEISEFSMSAPVNIPQTQEQFSDAVSYQELENTVFNILISSPNFREEFSSEIPQENAINLARTLTQQTFAPYDFNTMNSALSVVTEEVTKVTVPCPENFASALSKALVFIWKQHELSLSTDQSQLATRFLYGLDNSGQFQTQQETVGKQPQEYNIGETLDRLHPQSETVEKQPYDYYTSGAVQSEFNGKQADFDFQSPPFSPEDRKDEIFSLSLAQHLSKSEALRNFFCDEIESADKVQISFSIIKASLSDFGPTVSSLAASVASGVLSELSKDGLCSNYAKTISETVAEILEENGIANANAESVARKMDLCLIQRQIAPTESQKPPTMMDYAPLKFSQTEAVPELKSSFASVEEINPQYQEEIEHPKLATSFESEDISEDYYTYPITLLHTSTSLSTKPPNVRPEYYTPDGALDQQAYTDYLIEKFHVLESQDSEQSAEELTQESSAEDFSQDTGGREGRITSPLSHRVTTSSDYYEEVEEDYNPTATEDEEEILYNPNEDEIPQEDINHSDSTEFNGKTSHVVIQPSVPSPTSYSEYSTATFQPDSGVTLEDSQERDASSAFARQVSETAESSIAYIRSGNFELKNLCARMNQLAPLVDIPMLDYCEPIAAIDYLLNVLRSSVNKGCLK